MVHFLLGMSRKQQWIFDPLSSNGFLEMVSNYGFISGVFQKVEKTVPRYDEFVPFSHKVLLCLKKSCLVYAKRQVCRQASFGPGLVMSACERLFFLDCATPKPLQRPDPPQPIRRVYDFFSPLSTIATESDRIFFLECASLKQS